MVDIAKDSGLDGACPFHGLEVAGFKLDLTDQRDVTPVDLVVGKVVGQVCLRAVYRILTVLYHRDLLS